MTEASPPRLAPFAVFGGLLAAAGLPIYIHAPKFYVDTYAVSLSQLALVLAALRLIDVIQDPLLGRLAETLRHRRAGAVAVGVTLMVAGMVALFAVTPPVAPLLWFGITLTAVFSGFSFLTISFYAQGVTTGAAMPGDGHITLARWRETGALLGVCVAAVAPAIFAAMSDAPFTLFAVAFVGLGALALWMMRDAWSAGGEAPSTGLRAILADPLARRLLLIAFVNAAPVAVSSTLFLYFVESRLDAPGLEGPLLLLFFIAAAGAAPIWGRLASIYGSKPVLLSAMVLSIVAFAGALSLEAGDWPWFALICLVSGAALGADLTLLPAMFAKRMARISPSAADGFGAWNFMSKLSLGIAAITLLPILEAAGFDSAAPRSNSPGTLFTLTLLYAGVPCALKLGAVALLATTDLKET